MSVANCTAACGSAGYTLAGVEYASEVSIEVLDTDRPHADSRLVLVRQLCIELGLKDSCH